MNTSLCIYIVLHVYSTVCICEDKEREFYGTHWTMHDKNIESYFLSSFWALV